MKRAVGLMALLIAVLTVMPAAADFYVISGGGRLGTAINTVPFVITSSGLYYLNANLTHSGTNNNAITVKADDVTIDLMGFCLTGPGRETVSGSGIVVEKFLTNVEIRNGSIKAFYGTGILTLGENSGIRVVGLRVRDVGNGIRLDGAGNLVMACTLVWCDNNGIYCGTNSLVKGNLLEIIYNYGIWAGQGSTVSDNILRFGNGTGIDAKTGSSVTDNTVCSRGLEGILAGDNCTITRNTAYNNTLSGIATGNYCTITNNTADGLTKGSNCTDVNNTVTP